jgi:radical SAM protein with 4Fe4S-binding SPASM domain
MTIYYSGPPELLPPNLNPTAVVVDLRGAMVTAENQKNSHEIRDAVSTVLPKIIFQELGDPPKLFRVVAIETKSGCNLKCSFCPVGKSVDRREPGLLSIAIIEKILTELNSLNYVHTINLFGNNEPLADPRICTIVRMARDQIPQAFLKIVTNGTYLTEELCHKLFSSGLSRLVINNYSISTLIAPVRHILERSEKFDNYDIFISIRNPQEVLTTRGGLAPNKQKPDIQPIGFCALPFVDINVDYKGNVVTCCFDTHSNWIVGNVKNNSLVSLWVDQKFYELRAMLKAGIRDQHLVCRNCDFDGYRDPFQKMPTPYKRQALMEKLKHG